jgi:hypothetical protein
LSHGTVRDLRVGVHFTCDDNTRQFGNSIFAPHPASADDQALLDRLGLQVADPRHDGDETIGPFPPLVTTRRGFTASFEAPNASAIYDISGSFGAGAWTGSVRITEGWQQSPIGLIPNPDGGLVCDTGPVTFSARPVSP